MDFLPIVVEKAPCDRTITFLGRMNDRRWVIHCHFSPVRWKIVTRSLFFLHISEFSDLDVPDEKQSAPLDTYVIS